MKKKRKYTFRKNKLIPYQSGSVLHQMEKLEKSVFKKPKKKRK